MDLTKEAVVQAALSEVFGRIFSFLIDHFPRREPGARDVHRRRLEQLLGTIGSMVEEAESRHITNQQVLARLKALTEVMYRGRFLLEMTDLDDVKDADDDGGDATGAAAATVGKGKRSLALCSSSNKAKKRSRITSLILGGGGDGTERLAAAVEELETLTRDYMFIKLVRGYPRRVDRPVQTTLYMDRCVFGRHVEKERIVDFLLQRAPPRPAPHLSVLAVVGEKEVGKTTLVEHACHDERVRRHFACIRRFLGFSLLPEVVRRILGDPRFVAGRSLLVFDDAWPIDESALTAFAASTSALADGSKLLFTCRDADLVRLGTVEPVVLHPLQQEEYWHYFKAFAFGDADPRDHPRIAEVGREISERLDRNLLDARVLGTLLKAKFDARFWRRVLAAIVRCEHRPIHVGVLLELLPVGSRLNGYLYDYVGRSLPGSFTVQDLLSGRAGDGGGDSEECFYVRLCRETLYEDHWYYISLWGAAAGCSDDLA